MPNILFRLICLTTFIFMRFLYGVNTDKPNREEFQKKGWYTTKAPWGFTETSPYSNHTGQWRWYDADVNLEEKGFYQEGKQEGQWLEYDSNGNLEKKGFYQEGKQEGERLWYYSDGRLFSKEFYKEGKRDGEWFLVL